MDVLINSLIVAFLALAYRTIFAVVREKHYVKFHNAEANMILIFVTGLSLLLTPWENQKVIVDLNGQIYDLWLLMVVYSVAIIALARRVSRKFYDAFANTKLTMGVLVMSIVAQYIHIMDAWQLFFIILGTWFILAMVSKIYFTD
jgi:cation transport ATPase